MFQVFLLTITSFLLLGYVFLIVYYTWGWISLKRTVFDDDTKQDVHVSIIVSARNEERNIDACIYSLLHQSYPKQLTEIIIIDDHSEDSTAARIAAHPDVTLISLQEHLNGRLQSAYKKMAISLGIKQAKGELIVTTDADCTAPSRWLETLVNYYRKTNCSLIAMPVRIHNPNSFLSAFETLDFITLQGITAVGVSRQKIPLCNGANLAYKKSIFEAVGGFENIDHIASGDDMLFMQKVKKAKGKIGYLKSEDVIVDTGSAESLRAFIQQRKRWASKYSSYTDEKLKSIMVLVFLSNFSLLTLGLSAVIINKTIFTENIHFSLCNAFFSLFLVKCIVDFSFLYLTTGFFKQRKLLWWFLPAQTLHILYIVFFGIAGSFSHYEWKGRSVK